MTAIKNIPQKYLNILYVVIALLMYNAILLYKYFSIGIFTRNYILAQYAFTYQKMGFVSRGLLPSIFELFGINSQYTYYVFFNFIIVIYVLLVIYIRSLYNIKNKNYYIISFIFLFFGVPHFSLDAFRLDLVIQILTLLVFIALYHNKIYIALFVGFLSLFIHEASVFLIIPIFSLFMYNKRKIQLVSLSIAYLLFFGLIIIFSNKTTEHNAIFLVQKFLNTREIYKEMYTLHVKGSKRAHFDIFRTYNLSLLITVGFAYLIFIYYNFKVFFIKNIELRKLIFLLPFGLCLLGVDFFRWYCFVFFLLMIFQIHYFNSLSFYQFKNLILITLFLGIPISIETKFGIIHLFSKII
jgi:hypothetical protein